jgi:hypothetical protein
VKRSHTVNIVLLTAAMAALDGCGRQQCIDRNNEVVEDRYCEGQAPAGSYGYRWYNSGSSSGVAVGTRVDPASGTERGVFGGAGDAAGGHGSGGGDGAGAGE